MKILWILSLVILIPFAMPSDLQASAEEEIREIEAKFNGAYLENDLDTYFSFYAEDAFLAFSLQPTTLAGYKEMWYKMIADGGGVVKNDISDMQVRVGPSGDVAVATYLLEVHTRAADGNVSKARAIETDIWFKQDGAWKVVSAHYTSEEIE